jgi:hypothetical protein
MTTILDFVKIAKIEGVLGFFLIKHDGSVVAHKGAETDDLSPMIALSGLNCDAIKSVMGFTKFRYMVFSRKSKEHVIIFPLSSYFLAVIKQADSHAPDLIKKIRKFINDIKNKHTMSQTT